MKLGLIVRGDLRGLGIQTSEIWRHLKPSVTVGIDISPIDPRGSWPQFWDRYSDIIVTPWSGYLNPISVEAENALLSCDVLFSVETTYSPDLFEKARAKGIKTVIYVNSELWRAHETEHATEVWLPTEWRLENHPGAEVVPMPVALDRFENVGKGEGWLHVGGHQARGDRDGINIAMRAARGAGVKLTVTSQDRIRASSHFSLRQGTENYWELYDGMGFLVLPRRYGGLSLKAQEALANEMVVIMPDIPPNRSWPIVPIDATNGQWVNLPGGRIRMAHPDINDMVAKMKRLLTDPEMVERQRDASRRWARDHSWDVLGDVWREKLMR